MSEEAETQPRRGCSRLLKPGCLGCLGLLALVVAVVFAAHAPPPPR